MNNEKNLSPAPAARFIPNSSRKGRKGAKGAKGRKGCRTLDYRYPSRFILYHAMLANNNFAFFAPWRPWREIFSDKSRRRRPRKVFFNPTLSE